MSSVCVSCVCALTGDVRVYMRVQRRVRSDRRSSQEPLADAKSAAMELELRACDGITACTQPNVNCQRSSAKTSCPSPRHGPFSRSDLGKQLSGVTEFHTDAERFCSVLFLSPTVLVSFRHGSFSPHSKTSMNVFFCRQWGSPNGGGDEAKRSRAARGRRARRRRRGSHRRRNSGL